MEISQVFFFSVHTKFTFSQKDTGLHLHVRNTRCALNVNAMEINTQRHKVCYVTIGNVGRTNTGVKHTERPMICHGSEFGGHWLIHRGPTISAMMSSGYNCQFPPACQHYTSLILRCICRLCVEKLCSSVWWWEQESKHKILILCLILMKNAPHNFPKAKVDSWHLERLFLFGSKVTTKPINNQHVIKKIKMKKKSSKSSQCRNWCLSILLKFCLKTINDSIRKIITSSLVCSVTRSLWWFVLVNLQSDIYNFVKLVGTLSLFSTGYKNLAFFKNIKQMHWNIKHEIYLRCVSVSNYL